MTADEIRAIPTISGHADVFLQEIAAQLAELNQKASGNHAEEKKEEKENPTAGA